MKKEKLVMNINHIIANELSVKLWQVDAAIKLIDEGNTIPFIARYRKPVTGELNDEQLRTLDERLKYLRNLEEKKKTVVDSITEQGKMTDEIMSKIAIAETIVAVDDIYRPFRPKRKTRASVAKAKGLQGLADFLYAQDKNSNQPLVEAEKYLNDEVESIEDAINGAKDIIAEYVSDDPSGRKMLRYSIKNHGNIVVTGTKDDLGVYEMYKEYTEPISSVAPHRVLAFNRGEKEGFLKVGIDYDKITALTILYNLHIKESSPTEELVKEAIDDSYSRLIFPSIERELRNSLTENADEKAIGVFAENTRHLLMQPPVKGKVTLGLDPGYRTGCKVVCLDEKGELLLLMKRAKCLIQVLFMPFLLITRLNRLRKLLKTLLKNIMFKCLQSVTVPLHTKQRFLLAKLLKNSTAVLLIWL